MPTKQMDALSAAAVAAGGGEWWLDGAHDTVWGADGDAICRTFANIGHQPEPIDERQLAEFIAEACPANVIAAVNRIKELEAENASLHAKAERYDWLEKRFVGADFNWDGRGLSVLCFEIDKRMPITKDLSVCIDATVKAERGKGPD